MRRAGSRRAAPRIAGGTTSPASWGTARGRTVRPRSPYPAGSRSRRSVRLRQTTGGLAMTDVECCGGAWSRCGKYRRGYDPGAGASRSARTERLSVWRNIGVVDVEDHRGPLTNADVIQMVESKLSDVLIIHKIKNSKYTFDT